jgi:2-C-methyl-D-erythritol 4-phosphate cytidylyltransferase
MHVTAIVVAAGEGRRFNSKLPKLLNEINSVAIIVWCLRALDSHPLIKDIVVVGNSGNEQPIARKIKEYRFRKIARIIKGGRSRQDSVRSGLEVIDNSTDLVLIHDGARPFVDKGMISSVIREAKRFGAAIVGVPVKATIKEIHSPPFGCAQGKQSMVHRTLNRENLWEIQTPQVFRKELILEAHRKFANIEVTDDASLVEKLGVSVKVVMGSYNNIKITTLEDLTIGEAIANVIQNRHRL